ncbi:hypothetical protein E3P77_00300 [Wallemia ichthyophaga]|uniref:AAA protein C-terminal winged helix domain-containing protein n=2 Tax=Wallemia ichthyophaga TaxID=245174 RepID=A0A4T0HV99_WALIC|nr:hypothetical protein E3P91_03266 [Wallemia ichthyophaga]TIB15463.1 hypothetical protein E3P90_00945 [Wallemia ichthyophaga]TIB17225.1 hypothetical protein E3P93_00802 [Wallemia ichthyophaga]TIB20430.1 hypothetical protein E3P89_03218 [Wallemia ichthyophaga]TIB26811.1 hypothetical protein E3P88_00692 [Wallemia ichthyophaga]
MSTRTFSHTPLRRENPFNQQPSPGPEVTGVSEVEVKGENSSKKSGETSEKSLADVLSSNPAFAAVLSTILGLSVIFASGGVYLMWYKWSVLNKMEDAFAPGYDPATELAKMSDESGLSDDAIHINRPEKPIIKTIIEGSAPGKYYLLLGPKGTGKATMILDSMFETNSDRIAYCETHPDLEVFRLRVGKALNYEFLEDFYGALFQRREPRDAGPLLDIERALSKLEKVAMRIRSKHGKPIVFIFNNLHLLQNDETGVGVIHQLQQRAESWAESGIATFVFTSDDYWVLDKLKKNANRMKILSVHDLQRDDAIRAMRRMRKTAYNYNIDTKLVRSLPDLTDDVYEQVYSLIGGRMSHISHISREVDILGAARQLIQTEKAWLLSQIGLIPDMDDDVMDEQKWSSCSWALLAYLARQKTVGSEDEDDESTVPDNMDPAASPHVSFYKARQLMTRTDFLEPLDRLNILSMDVNHNVRMDSHVLLTAAREFVSLPNFDKDLEATMNRVSDIEWLGRTRRLVLTKSV